MVIHHILWECQSCLNASRIAKDYGQDVFGRANFDRLAEQLAGIKGKFILSINDTSGGRATFAAFRRVEVGTTYTVGAGAAAKAAELIIPNFDLP